MTVQVVVLVENHSREEMLRINSICRAHEIAFIAGGVYGLFGFVFNDFGPQFLCLDPNGEAPKTAFIETITKVMMYYITIFTFFSRRNQLSR